LDDDDDLMDDGEDGDNQWLASRKNDGVHVR
jgi:hypothetical protein